MPRTSYANILQLPDAAQSWNFDLFFPQIPGSNGQARNLSYKCKTSELPTSKIEPVDIELHGTKKREAGRASYDHNFNATFMETIDWATYQTFRAWRKYMRDWKNNAGTDSTAYKVNLELDLYDNAGNVSQTIILAGAFPTDINQVQLDGSQNTVIELQIGFSFDYLNDGNSF